MSAGAVVPQPLSVGIVSLGACALSEPGCGIPVGGSELQLYLLARALGRQADVSATLYVADVGQAERVEDNVRVRPLVRLKPSLALPPLSLPRIIRLLARGGHDLYVTRSASSINGLVCLATHRAGGRYLHMCAHDDECCGAADSTLSAPARWLHHFGLFHADAITCQNARQREDLLKTFRREAAIMPSLPPMVAGDVEGPRQGLLWVGRDVDWKRPEAFVELARRVGDAPCTMVLQPQPGREVQRLAPGAPANLTLVPGLPFREVSALFPRHRALVCTSRAEGFPNVFVQAVCAGTPILSLNVDPDRFVSGSGAGFVCDDSMDELVRRAQTLLTDDAVWAACHAGALCLAKDQAEAETRLVAFVRGEAKR